MAYARQYWTEEGLTTLLLTRADWENEFERVMAQGGKGKRRDAGHETQNALWDQLIEEMKTNNPGMTLVKNSKDEAEDVSGEQCSTKFYNVHTRMRSIGEQIESKDRDLPLYLLKPKVLFHMLSHTRTGGFSTEKHGTPPIYKSKPGASAVVEYVRERDCPDVPIDSTEEFSQELAKKVFYHVLFVKDAIHGSGKVAEEDTVESWRELIEEIDPDFDNPSLAPVASTTSSTKKRERKPRTPATYADSTESKSGPRVKRAAAARNYIKDESTAFSTDSEDEEEIQAIEENGPPMSSAVTPQTRAPSQAPVSQGRSYYPSGVNGYRGREAPSSRKAFNNLPKFLIFEENPFSQVVAKRNSSVYNISPASWEGARDPDSTFAYQLEPHKRLADVLLYLVKDESLSEEDRQWLGLAHLAMGFDKYRHIMLTVAQLACPDNHYMDVERFLELLSDKIQQLGLSFNRLSMELARL